MTKKLGDELAPEIEVLRHLGSGKAAEVFLARETALGRLVAVKVLSERLAGDEVALKRFEREARAAAALNHPNAVSVHRFGYLSTGVPYLAMHYVKGGTLRDKLAAEGTLSVEKARRVLAEVSDALAAAHEKGFVHRDVRPGNVLCDTEGQRVLVSDFGLAGILPQGGSSDPRITRTGELLSLPAFMSPEQLRGEDPTEGTDVYALGILGYEILTGEGPFHAPTDRDLMVAHLKSPPRPLLSLRPDAGQDLADLLERCLAKEPGQRPSAAFLAKAVRGEVSPTGTPPTHVPGGSGVVSDLVGRRMPQVVVVTGVVGYALLQFVDMQTDRGLFADWAYRLALITFIYGVIASAAIAWFHGKKGRQKISPLEIVILGVLIIAWVVTGVFFVPG
jgi:serine/threonine protein kinase